MVRREVQSSAGISAPSTGVLCAALCAVLQGCVGELAAFDDAYAPGDAATPRDGAIAPRRDAAPADARDTPEIIAFAFEPALNTGLTEPANGTIHGTNIAVEVPFGTHLTALVPSVLFTGMDVSPEAGDARDFTHPVTYTVFTDRAELTYSVTVHVAPNCTPTVPACNRDVYNRARAFAAAHPRRPVSGASWDQACVALMFWFGGFSHSANDANIAYAHSHIVSTDPSTAPIGAFHWWAYGLHGHVGVDLLGGGTTVFMASVHLGSAAWAPYVGVNSVGGYDAQASARYRGWSMDFVGQRLSGGGAPACRTTPEIPAVCVPAHSATATDGVPDTNFWMRLQLFASSNGYTGPINGVMNPAAWVGVQRGLRAEGYPGPDDGIPDVNTYMALQRLAARHGYAGAINGVLDADSYKALATFLNSAY